MLKHLDLSQTTKNTDIRNYSLGGVDKSSRFKGRAFTFALVGVGLAVANHNPVSPLPSHVSSSGRVGEVFEIMPMIENNTNKRFNKIITGHYEGEAFSVDLKTDIVEGHKIEAVYSNEFDYEINFDEDYQYSPSSPSYRMVIDS